jgi:HD-like signal output (HDOD) protein
LVEQALKDRPIVRPFPTPVGQLLAVCHDPDATEVTFEKVIERDPALSVRLLRMANSPLHGLSYEVHGVGQAVSLLGIRELKHFALTVAGVGIVADGSATATLREALWNHSLGCAIVARLLAERQPARNGDDAFLAGILHDVGKLLLLDVVPEEYGEMAQQYRGNQLIADELFAFGISHEEIGLRSAHGWSLAENVKVAIGYHHRPGEAPIHGEFVQLIATANHLARYWGIGSPGHEDADAAVADLKRLELSDFEAQVLAERAATNFQDAARAVGI